MKHVLSLRPRSALAWAAALFSTAALSGCSGSSAPPGDTEPAPTNNLTTRGLEIASAESRVGYGLAVRTEIEAAEMTENVSVSFFALNRSDIDQGLEHVRQFYLATVNFPAVEQGVSDQFAEFTIPPGVDPPGDWVIRAALDPAELIGETNEDDNFSEVLATFAPRAAPNIFIERLTLDSSVILLDADYDDVEGEDPEDVQNSDDGATLVIGLEGTLEPVDVEVSVDLRITRTDLPVGQDTFDLPMYLWDSEAQAWIDAYGLIGPPARLPLGSLMSQMVTETEDAIDFTATDRKSAHLEVYFPGGLADVLIDILDDLSGTGALDIDPDWVPPPDLPAEIVFALRSFFHGATADQVSYELIAEIESSDGSFVDDDPSDNVAARELSLLLPGSDSHLPSNPLAFEEGAAGGWENEQFGIGFEFGGSASLDERGAIAAVVGVVPITVFGSSLDLVEFNARAQVVPAIDPETIPEGENSGFYLNLDFAGITIYSLEKELGFLFPDPAVPGEEPLISFTQGKNFSSVYFVGPVPITIGAGIEGSIGFELHANIQPVSLATGAGPFAQLEANVTGAVGIPGLQAGVGGALTLLDERFTGTVSTGLTVVHSNPGAAVFEGEVSLTIKNVLTGPAGRLFLFAEFPAAIWCNSPLGAFPCGIKLVRAELVLANWSSFAKEDILFDESLCKAVTITANGVTFHNCH